MASVVTGDLQGKVAVVTGANTGMGKVIARELARLGAQVVLACRDPQKAEAARAEIAKDIGADRFEVGLLDVAKQASVREFAATLVRKHPKIDILVNNAGAWWLDRRESPDGIELQWATNVLGPHLLTQLLLPALKASGAGRIVNMASTAAGGLDLDDVEFKRRKFSGVSAYSATKQADRMLTWSLAEKLQGSGVVANAISPGLVATDLNRSTKGFFRFFFMLMKPMARTPEKGADTAVWLAASPEAAGQSGKFFVDRKERPCKFRVPDQMERLWQLCEAQSAAGRPAA
jgi:NAD(P)-dependent dehydrogenase (short-subunit alcohol dehydrogenase family)